MLKNLFMALYLGITLAGPVGLRVVLRIELGLVAHKASTLLAILSVASKSIVTGKTYVYSRT